MHLGGWQDVVAIRETEILTREGEVFGPAIVRRCRTELCVQRVEVLSAARAKLRGRKCRVTSLARDKVERTGAVIAEHGAAGARRQLYAEQSKARRGQRVDELVRKGVGVRYAFELEALFVFAATANCGIAARIE